jgi:hypothetical protein
MIEYGYALKAVGDQRIIPIFNEGFGSPEALPFDMRHKRWPTRYRALPADSVEERQRARESLADALERHIVLVMEGAGLARTAAFEPATPKDGSASFLGPDEPLPYTSSAGFSEESRNLHLRKGAKMFMRLMPTAARPPLSHTDVMRCVREGPLMPLSGSRHSGWNYSRNRYGAYSFTEFTSTPGVVQTLSQLFRSGEIWGIDAYLPNVDAAKEFAGVDFPYLPTGAIETSLADTLNNYLRVAQVILSMTPPLRLIVGAAGIANYRLAVPRDFAFGGFAGHIFDDDVIYEAPIRDLSMPPSDILTPFHAKLWDAAGLQRPPNLRASG